MAILNTKMKNSITVSSNIYNYYEKTEVHRIIYIYRPKFKALILFLRVI